ncbi:MAG: lytic murein transglycosylase [Desulfobulbaceae bacterium]
MKKLLLLPLVLLLVFGQSARGDDGKFSQCIALLQERAREEGLSSRVIEKVLPGLQHQPRVIELDRSQPEFTRTFAEYLNRRLTEERVEIGRRLLDHHADFLGGLTRKYGVPGHYLVAFWGLETNFGTYLGTMPTLDCLATLACDTRRSAFFTDELLKALALMERESFSPEEMRGSWAGAMGHTQFMPSAYLSWAVDGDGDGRIDLWDSELDALASGANFLAGLGWQRGERWGREVLLPRSFPYEQSGLTNRRPLRYWSELGVRMASGGRLPDVEMEAALLLPSGHTGPAFLVYRNFDVIMRWNRSQFYALSVGLLADRLAGSPGLVRPPSPGESPLSRQSVMTMQHRLNTLGYEAGSEDGVIGANTRSALRTFQKQTGLAADGYPDTETLDALENLSKKNDEARQEQ